jgi:hypothetical protein
MSRSQTPPLFADTAAGDYTLFVAFLRRVAARASGAPVPSPASGPDAAACREAAEYLRAVAAAAPGTAVSLVVESLRTHGPSTVADLIESDPAARSGWMSTAGVARLLDVRAARLSSRKDSK